MRGGAVRGVLVPGGFATTRRFTEYAPPTEETRFLNGEQACDSFARIAQEEGILQCGNNCFRRNDGYQGEGPVPANDFCQLSRSASSLLLNDRIVGIPQPCQLFVSGKVTEAEKALGLKTTDLLVCQIHL